jgi:putative zinc finger protein
MMDSHTMCDNKQLLVGYLYNEMDDAERVAFDTHVSSCAECREELAELRSTRAQLTSWAPPEPDFGFRIVRGAAAPPPAAPRRFGYTPAWGLAAAAVLVLAAAAAIAQVEIRYGQEGFVVRTGWGRAAGAAEVRQAGRDATVLPVATPVDWKVEIDALERRLQQVEAGATARAQGPAVRLADGPRMSDAEVVRRVREMIGQSETRQQQDLAVRLTALAREVDRQRRVDLVMMQQGLEGASGADAARHNQMMSYLRRVALQQK